MANVFEQFHANPFAQFHPEQSSHVGDVLGSLGTGVAKGAIGLAGSAGDIRELGKQGIDALARYLNIKPEDIQGALSAVARGFPVGGLAEAAVRLGPTSADITEKVQEATGPLYKPQTTAGEFAQTIGEFAPAMALGPGGAARNLLTALPKAVAPGVASEGAGQFAKARAPQYEPLARLGGAFAGGYLGGRALTPAPATPERARLAGVLEAEGVPLTAGQRTGNKPLQWFEAAAADTPFAAAPAARANEAQSRAFTGAALRRMGASGDEIATPEVLARESGRISRTFEDLSARNAILPDKYLRTDLLKTKGDYEKLVGSNARAPIVDDTLNDIVSQFKANGGVLPGETYQAMRSSLDRTARSIKQSNPELSDALFSIRNALDKSMARSISADDAKAWANARREWKNWKAIERAATGSGSATAEGFISPSQLRTAVAGQDRGSYARGRGDLAELSRAGEALLKPLPQSGTAPRQAAGNLFASMAGGLLGSQTGMGMEAILAGMAFPAAAGRAVLSRPVQGYLGNQIAPMSREDRMLSSLLALYQAQQPQLPRR